MLNKKQTDQSVSNKAKTSEEKKVKNKLEKFYRIVKEHDIAYYKNHNPIISDAEYDDLRRSLSLIHI